MISKSAIKMLEIHNFASSACRIYPCKGATWAVTKVVECDARIEAVLKRLKEAGNKPAGKLPAPRYRITQQPNALGFDIRAALHAILGTDLTQINGLGSYLALKLVSECGTDLSAWPSAKHFTSWLCL